MEAPPADEMEYVDALKTVISESAKFLDFKCIKRDDHAPWQRGGITIFAHTSHPCWKSHASAAATAGDGRHSGHGVVVANAFAVEGSIQKI